MSEKNGSLFSVAPKPVKAHKARKVTKSTFVPSITVQERVTLFASKVAESAEPLFYRKLDGSEFYADRSTAEIAARTLGRILRTMGAKIVVSLQPVPTGDGAVQYGITGREARSRKYAPESL